ncbi:UDP-GlcNAc--UDP-phosphate GlcNAc-1-phosphate transferase [Emticicia sp. CRIBPO]|uniref:MraY family glycosyltransferase n=1 Tax=Emticicia sp. CRIBPO TaxID=2683258 RepID=UPI001412049D|nr:glycosyltransferase family 4 protein [Emticicia sp. CRIBPO]NBA87082.1 UDP-GlcNAc--UDP-phosphate GlcNAc-1-phosphate transferase [Emticicia sp. CRIBPO]
MLKFLILTIFASFLALVYFRIADYFNIVDRPNERSSHSVVTIRGGGVVFFITALAYFVYSDFSYPFFFLGLTGVSLISFADDIFTLPNRYRLPFQFLAIFCILYQLDFLSQYPWLIFSLSLIVGVGIINIYNFMDGINGLTGGYSLLVILALWMVNNHHLYFIDNNFLYFISASLLAFNFFNFRKKAVCFAGDVGSISIAVIILFLITKLSIEDRNPVYFLFLSVYGIDGVITILERLYLKENIFKAHRRHLFQILVNEKKIPHLIIASLYATVQFLISIFIIYNIDQDFTYRNILSGILVLGLLFVYCLVKFAIVKPEE